MNLTPQPTLSPAVIKEQPSHGAIVWRPIGLQHPEPVIEMLNPILADALTLRDLYKKHHWQVSGSTFYQLHVLFDKHHREQDELVDLIAERIQILGGVSVAMGADASELTRIPRPPRGREAPEAQITRLLAAHEILIRGIREGARMAASHGDDGTNDLLIGGVLRTNEMHVWFLAGHLVLTEPQTNQR